MRCAFVLALTFTPFVLNAQVAPVHPQHPGIPPIPQVIVTGQGEVEVKPDRARLEMGVETRASSAAVAATENAQRQRAVLEVIQRLGVALDNIQTANLQVTPEMVYPGQGQPPRVAGYVARNSVRIEVLRLEQTGELVDGALAKGATEVVGLQFYSSQAAEARRTALARAVTAARLDAEAMVNAVGFKLGSIIEITGASQPENPVLMSMDIARPVRVAGARAPTPVTPGALKISETVTIRWAIKE